MRQQIALLGQLKYSKLKYFGRIRQPDVSRNALGFTVVLSFFFSRDTALSSHAEDAHQMYSRGSVVGEATIIDLEISPTYPLIF